MTARKSNVELLRILAMLMVIGVHFYAYETEVDRCFYEITESFCIGGVNIFVMISAWFMTGRKSINIRKIVNLLIEVAFWGIIGFSLMVVFNMDDFSVKGLIKVIAPYFWGNRWFVEAYAIYFVFLPYLNLIVETISKRLHAALLGIMFCLFCIWPTFLPNPPIDDYGYGFLHFIFLFMLVSYIKLYTAGRMPKKWICAVGYIVFSLISAAESHAGMAVSWAYNNVVVVAAALCLFMVFIQMSFNCRTINILASAAFGVFLIHTDGFFSEIIYGQLFRVQEVINGNIVKLMFSFFLCLPVFYILGWILEMLRKIMFQFTVDKLLNRIKILNYEISVDS